MTFDAVENSDHDGSPIELFLFRQGSSNTWRYTSGDTTVQHLGLDFEPTYIESSSIKLSEDPNQRSLKVTVDRNNDVAALYRDYPPSDVVTLTIFNSHLSDVDNEVLATWSGRVLSSERLNNQAVLQCESIFISSKRIGLRRSYSRNCPYPLYSNQCGVDRESFRVTDTISSISGTTVTFSQASAQANGYYNGGYMEFTRSDGGTDTRMILDHTGSDLVLNARIDQSFQGSTASIFPGCQRTTNECANKFSNLLNFGGQPYIPTKNPFDTQLF